MRGENTRKKQKKGGGTVGPISGSQNTQTDGSPFFHLQLLPSCFPSNKHRERETEKLQDTHTLSRHNITGPVCSSVSST
jgi:hypothetical protein